MSKLLKKNIKVINGEVLLDVSRTIIKKGFGVIGLKFKISGGSIFDLEIYEDNKESQKPVPASFRTPPSDVQANINSMLRFLGKLELMAAGVGFGSLFLRLTIKNSLPYRFTSMSARRRRYTVKKK